MEKKSTQQRVDPQTGELFWPKRHNQLFANRKNQIAFNNAKASVKRFEKGTIDKVLDKNRRILKQILGEKDGCIVSKDFLLGCGFVFRYYTHVVNIDKETGYCVYEFILKKNENEKYKIWKWNLSK
jgi:hypothetical protein